MASGFFTCAGMFAAVAGILQAQPRASYDTPPTPVTVTAPDYPEEARADGVEGTVLVELTVDEEGLVRDPIVVDSVEGLDEAALACVVEWVFQPALKDAKPVAAVARVPVIFRLSKRE